LLAKDLAFIQMREHCLVNNPQFCMVASGSNANMP
jgi:hypothetical protein